jgi:sulfate/thiosulfate transport system ATP-binding protein
MTLQLTGIHKRFGAAAVLDDVSVSVSDGEFLALVGPSGSGKTTLLRVIAGLEAAESGSLVIDGRPMEGVAARDRHIGFVFQNYALFRHLTVAENIAFGLRVQPRAIRPKEQAIRARVQSLLDLVHIPELGRRMPAQLSGGQRQRVALARALATGPRLMLLDEPFGALDPLVRKTLRQSLRALHEELGLTTILVTHDQEEALELADRIAVMRNGRIAQIGTAAALEADPASAFVYRFLGETEAFLGEVAGHRMIFDEPGLAPISAPLPRGRAVALIRPHALRLQPGPGSARVVSARRVGPLLRYRVEFAGRELEVIAAASETLLPLGTPCGLDVREARLFPAEETAPPARGMATTERALAPLRATASG